MISYIGTAELHTTHEFKYIHKTTMASVFFASAYFNITAFRDKDVTMHIMVFTRVFSEREMILWSRANVPTIWAEPGWAEWRRPVTHPRGQPGSASSGQLRPHTTHSVSSDHPPSEHRSTADIRPEGHHLLQRG